MSTPLSGVSCLHFGHSRRAGMATLFEMNWMHASSRDGNEKIKARTQKLIQFWFALRKTFFDLL